MDKNEFEKDFDFEKEYGFDPNTFLGADEYDDNTDFTDEELGLTSIPEADSEEASEAFDMDEDFDEYLNLNIRNADEEEAEAMPSQEEEDFPDDLFATKQVPVIKEEPFPVNPEEEPAESDEESEENDLVDQSIFEDEFMDEEDDEDEENEDPDMDAPNRRSRKQFALPKINLPKLKTPNIFTKFYDLYFAPVMNKEMLQEPQDPNNPRRRRRKSKQQIFKEVYLPPIIVCVSLILVLSFAIGSLSNAIAEKKANDALKQSQVDASEDAEALKELEYQSIMDAATELAAGYNYGEAITLLDSFGDMSKYPEMQAKRAEFVNIQSQLVEHKDLSMIPNLSFHVLIEDPVRAFADTELGGKYNRNFVTTAEFRRILEDLYANGYVLVDFDDVTAFSADTSGTEQFFPNPVLLPAGKKPIMLTETLVNYFAYMIDGNDDGVADANGDGFASKLVVQNGTIEAEYVDSTGQTLVGDYDFVPILEAFIEEHPDFSYRGARATLAVTGTQGVFGYRTNTSYIATKGQDYYNNEVAGAKEVVDKLREMGYNIACFTYNNENYRNMTAAQITADLQQWTNQITPVIGEVNTLVFAQASDIQNYNDNAFKVLYTSGFRYFVANGDEPWAEINNTYVRQKRLMVTGNSMAWHTSYFNGMFDCAAILDVNNRGNVPN